MTSGFATVKGVTSGDTLLLVGRAAGPAARAPADAERHARRGCQVERRRRAFARAARDLRRLALGGGRSFRVDGEAAGRSFGAAWLKTGAASPSRWRSCSRGRAGAARRRRARRRRRRRGAGRPRPTRAAGLGAHARAAGRRDAARPVDGLRRGRAGGDVARASSSTCATGRTCDASCTASRGRAARRWRSSCARGRPPRPRRRAASRPARRRRRRSRSRSRPSTSSRRGCCTARSSCASRGADGGRRRARGRRARGVGARVGVARREAPSSTSARWRRWATPRSRRRSAPPRPRRAATSGGARTRSRAWAATARTTPRGTSSRSRRATRR